MTYFILQSKKNDPDYGSINMMVHKVIKEMDLSALKVAIPVPDDAANQVDEQDSLEVIIEKWFTGLAYRAYSDKMTVTDTGDMLSVAVTQLEHRRIDGTVLDGRLPFGDLVLAYEWFQINNLMQCNADITYLSIKNWITHFAVPDLEHLINAVFGLDQVDALKRLKQLNQLDPANFDGDYESQIFHYLKFELTLHLEQINRYTFGKTADPFGFLCAMVGVHFNTRIELQLTLFDYLASRKALIIKLIKDM